MEWRVGRGSEVRGGRGGKGGGEGRGGEGRVDI